MKEVKRKILLAVSGVATGLANGFFGGGGGMIVVPMLSLLLGYSPKKSHATAILVMLPVSIASAVVYFIKGKFSFEIGLPVVIGVAVGGVVGALLLKKLSAKWLVKIFALIMLVAGLKIAL